MALKTDFISTGMVRIIQNVLPSSDTEHAVAGAIKNTKENTAGTNIVKFSVTERSSPFLENIIIKIIYRTPNATLITTPITEFIT